MKTLYVPAYLRKDITPSLIKALKLLSGFRNVGIVTTAQHINQIHKAFDFLKNAGINPVLGGQIIGCNQDNAEKIGKKVDCFLYIGSGRFHPVKLAVETGKKVVVANPYSDSAEEITERECRIYRKKYMARVLKAAEGRIFGVVVSTRSRQFNVRKALQIKKKLESLGKKAFIFAGSDISPQNLLGYGVDAWVNTACPRLPEDEFDKPMINPEDLRLLRELMR